MEYSNTSQTSLGNNANLSPERHQAILALGSKNKALIAWQLTRARIFPYWGIIFLFVLASIASSATIIALCELSIAFSLLFIPTDIAFLLFSLGLTASVLRYIDGVEARIRLSTLFEPFKRWLALLPIGLIYVVLCIPDHLQGLGFWEPYSSRLIVLFYTLLWYFLVYFYFFMADCPSASLTQIFQVPFLLLTRQPKIWLQAMLPAMLVYVGLVVLAGAMWLVVSLVSPHMDLVACYIYQDLATIDLLGAILVLIFILILLILLLIFSVYSMFLFGIAYKQSRIACEADI